MNGKETPRQAHEAAKQLDDFLDTNRLVLMLLFDQQISVGKCIEALREIRAGNKPALPELGEKD